METTWQRIPLPKLRSRPLGPWESGYSENKPNSSRFPFQTEEAQEGRQPGTRGPDSPSGRVTAETSSPISLFRAGVSSLGSGPEPSREPSGKGTDRAGVWGVYCGRSFPSPGARVSRGVCGFLV